MTLADGLKIAIQVCWRAVKNRRDQTTGSILQAETPRLCGAGKPWAERGHQYLRLEEQFPLFVGFGRKGLVVFLFPFTTDETAPIGLHGLALSWWPSRSSPKGAEITRLSCPSTLLTAEIFGTT